MSSMNIGSSSSSPKIQSSIKTAQSPKTEAVSKQEPVQTTPSVQEASHSQKQTEHLQSMTDLDAKLDVVDQQLNHVSPQQIEDNANGFFQQLKSKLASIGDSISTFFRNVLNSIGLGQANPAPVAINSPALLGSYLQLKTPEQQQAIGEMQNLFTDIKEPLTTPQSRGEFKTRLNELEQKMQDKGLHFKETGAIKAQFLKQYVPMVNHELSAVLNQPGYDYKQDPTLSTFQPEDFKQFIGKMDLEDSIAGEIRSATGGIEQTPDNLKAFFKTRPGLLKDLRQALDPKFIPKDSQSEMFTDQQLTEIFSPFTNNKGEVKPFTDKLKWISADGKGASKGADEVGAGTGYSSLADSANRMERKSRVLQSALDLDDPVKQKQFIDMRKTNLETKLQKLTEQHQNIQGMLAVAPQDNKTALQTNSLKLAYQIRQVSREIKDVDDLKTVLDKKSELESQPTLTPQQEQELKTVKFDLDTLKAIGDLSPVERFSLAAYTSQFYNKINNTLRGDMMSVNSQENPDIMNWTKISQSALNKLPSYEGVTFRQESQEPYTNIRQIGMECTSLALGSTASSIDGTVGAAKRGVLSINRVKSGKIIAPLSHFGAAEKEVLLRPFATTRVEARIEKGDSETWEQVLNKPEYQNLFQEYGVDKQEILQDLQRNDSGRKGTTKVINFSTEV